MSRPWAGWSAGLAETRKSGPEPAARKRPCWARQQQGAVRPWRGASGHGISATLDRSCRTGQGPCRNASGRLPESPSLAGGSHWPFELQDHVLTTV